jgi:CPA1 family monovalent cation:H+ antiporter
MEITIERIEILLFIASLVAIFARRLQIPYTIGLVITGWVLAWVAVAPNVHFSKELVYGVLLPPLIFEAAFHLKWRHLRADLAPVLVLATAGVVIAAGVTAAILHLATGVSWSTSIIIGVVLSATDPVSVLSLLKEYGLSGRVRLLVEAESLFNDGTTAVLFALTLALVSGSATLGDLAGFSVIAILGALAIGVLVGGFCLVLAGKTDDHLVEITVTTIAAFGSFILAEDIGASGVLSTLVAGMILGNLGHFGAITPRGREATVSFWEFIGFVANSLIFLLIGIELTSQHLWGIVPVVLCTVIASLAGRAAAVYTGCLVVARSRGRVPLQIQHILFWGGLRGALALAFVFGLQNTIADRHVIVTSVFYAVAFSVTVQGLSVGVLIKRIQRDESAGSFSRSHEDTPSPV